MTALGQHFKSLLIDSALRSGSSRWADAEHRHAPAAAARPRVMPSVSLRR